MYYILHFTHPTLVQIGRLYKCEYVHENKNIWVGNNYINICIVYIDYK